MLAPPEASSLQEQSEIYLRERNKQIKTKRLRAEMELACRSRHLKKLNLMESPCKARGVHRRMRDGILQWGQHSECIASRARRSC
jgi:hypothetical protein